MPPIKPFLATDSVTMASRGHGSPLADSRLLKRRPLRPLERLALLNGFRSGSRVGHVTRKPEAPSRLPTNPEGACAAFGARDLAR